MPDSDNRWMPPSPHRERILEEIASGAAHIIERGHGIPPLLVFEDGGMIELPRVRLQLTRRGMQLTAAEEPASRGETHFYDVCGTVDEILGRVRDGRELDPDDMSALVGDIGYMLERMARRAAQYAGFLDSVRAVLDEHETLECPATGSAPDRLDALTSSLAGSQGSPINSDAVTESAEYVRALAQASEDYLAECRRAAMRIGVLLDEIRGGRSWASAQHAVAPVDGNSGASGTDRQAAEHASAASDRPDGGMDR